MRSAIGPHLTRIKKKLSTQLNIQNLQVGPLEKNT